MLHLDLKSLNLLVDDNLRLKVPCRQLSRAFAAAAHDLSSLALQVGDFGLATLKKAKQSSSVDAMGTVHWMAPELLAEGRADEKADVYALQRRVLGVVRG